MSSKKLHSILNTVPAATAFGQNRLSESLVMPTGLQELTPEVPDKIEKLSARIPSTLKEEIRKYVRSHKGETETTIILKALKLMGFDVPNSLLLDQRSKR